MCYSSFDVNLHLDLHQTQHFLYCKDPQVTHIVGHRFCLSVCLSHSFLSFFCGCLSLTRVPIAITMETAWKSGVCRWKVCACALNDLSRSEQPLLFLSAHHKASQQFCFYRNSDSKCNRTTINQTRDSTALIPQSFNRLIVRPKLSAALENGWFALKLSDMDSYDRP